MPVAIASGRSGATPRIALLSQSRAHPVGTIGGDDGHWDRRVFVEDAVRQIDAEVGVGAVHDDRLAVGMRNARKDLDFVLGIVLVLPEADVQAAELPRHDRSAVYTLAMKQAVCRRHNHTVTDVCPCAMEPYAYHGGPLAWLGFRREGFFPGTGAVRQEQRWHDRQQASSQTSCPPVSERAVRTSAGHGHVPPALPSTIHDDTSSTGMS